MMLRKKDAVPYFFLCVCSCGRLNLSHVTKCYRCGVTLPPPASSKWVSGQGMYIIIIIQGAGHMTRM